MSDSKQTEQTEQTEQTKHKLTNAERLEYITTNEYELTQLAIKSRLDYGDGALMIDLDNTASLENNEMNVNYCTNSYMKQCGVPQYITDVITSNIGKECVHFIYIDEDNKSIILEKRIGNST